LWYFSIPFVTSEKSLVIHKSLKRNRCNCGIEGSSESRVFSRVSHLRNLRYDFWYCRDRVWKFCDGSQSIDRVCRSKLNYELLWSSALELKGIARLAILVWIHVYWEHQVSQYLCNNRLYFLFSAILHHNVLLHVKHRRFAKFNPPILVWSNNRWIII